MPVNWATLLALTSPDFDLYSSNTVRTIQSATWFSAGKKLTVDKRLLQCGNEIYSAIKDLQAKRLIKISSFYR